MVTLWIKDGVAEQIVGAVAQEASARLARAMRMLGDAIEGMADGFVMLPDLAHDQSLEVSAVHSVAGVLRPDDPLVRRPPFLDPHHTASMVSVIGGGSRHIRPGAVSLAHHGVLFLDEAPEFPSNV